MRKPRDRFMMAQRKKQVTTITAVIGKNKQLVDKEKKVRIVFDETLPLTNGYAEYELRGHVKDDTFIGDKIVNMNRTELSPEILPSLVPRYARAYYYIEMDEGVDCDTLVQRALKEYGKKNNINTCVARLYFYFEEYRTVWHLYGKLARVWSLPWETIQEVLNRLENNKMKLAFAWDSLPAVPMYRLDPDKSLGEPMHEAMAIKHDLENRLYQKHPFEFKASKKEYATRNPKALLFMEKSKWWTESDSGYVYLTPVYNTLMSVHEKLNSPPEVSDEIYDLVRPYMDEFEGKMKDVLTHALDEHVSLIFCTNAFEPLQMLKSVYTTKCMTWDASTVWEEKEYVQSLLIVLYAHKLDMKTFQKILNNFKGNIVLCGDLNSRSVSRPKWGPVMSYMNGHVKSTTWDKPQKWSYHPWVGIVPKRKKGILKYTVPPNFDKKSVIKLVYEALPNTKSTTFQFVASPAMEMSINAIVKELHNPGPCIKTNDYIKCGRSFQRIKKIQDIVADGKAKNCKTVRDAKAPLAQRQIVTKNDLVIPYTSSLQLGYCTSEVEHTPVGAVVLLWSGHFSYEDIYTLYMRTKKCFIIITSRELPEFHDPPGPMEMFKVIQTPETSCDEM